MRDDLQAKRNLFYWWADRIPGVKPLPSEGAFYSFWDVSSLFGKHTPRGAIIANSDDLTEYLIDSAGAVVLSGCDFEQNGYLRLCFHIPKEEIRVGLEHITEAIKALE